MLDPSGLPADTHATVNIMTTRNRTGAFLFVDSDRRRQITEYVRFRLAEIKQTRGGIAELARRTKFSAAHISHLTTEFRSPGPDFLERVCEVWGISFEELLRLAAEHDAGAADEFPNRKAAFEAVGDEIAPEVIAAVREMRIAADLKKTDWIALLAAKQKEHEILSSVQAPEPAKKPR